LIDDIIFGSGWAADSSGWAKSLWRQSLQLGMTTQSVVTRDIDVGTRHCRVLNLNLVDKLIWQRMG